MTLSCAASSLHSAQTNQLNKNTSPFEKIGWLLSQFLAIKNPNLVAGTTINIQSMSKNSPALISEILEHTQDEQTCNAFFADRKAVNIAAGYSFYTVKNQSLVNLTIGILKLNP